MVEEKERGRILLSAYQPTHEACDLYVKSSLCCRNGGDQIV